MNILCVHLLTQPSEERERRSISEVLQLRDQGIELVQTVNRPYQSAVPTPPRVAADRHFTLSPGFYGCWLAHRNAIETFLKDVDALLICECDCLFLNPPDKTAELVRRALTACNEGNLAAFTLGYRHGGKTIDRVGEDVIVISQWIETHCYVVPIQSRDIFVEMFQKPWDAIDMCYTIYLYDQQKLRIGAFADRPAAIQADGISLANGDRRTSEDFYRNVKH